MKKVLKRLAVILAAVSLTGCQSNIEPAADIAITVGDRTKTDISEAVEAADIPVSNAAVADKSNESTDISADEAVITDSEEGDFIPRLLMETNKPFVLAEDKYIIEKQDIDASVFNEYGYARFIDDGKFYYSYGASFEYSGSEATIFAYDSKSGELITLYSEAPKGEGSFISLEIKMISGSYLYFYREEAAAATENQPFQMLGRDLYRVDLRDNTAEKIFAYMDEEVMPTYPLAESGDILFIPTVHEALNNYKFMIFQYDMNTGEASLFRDYAHYPIPYNNGIVYYHDGGFYYHGEASDIKGQGVFYEGDELVFNSAYDGLHEDLVSDFGLDTLMYACADNTEHYIEAETDFGIFDKEFNKNLIAHTKKGTWAIQIGGISTSGLVSVGAPKPMIYDTNEECFAVIPIDDYKYYDSFVTDDSVCFFAYEYDSDYNYLSAALYTVKRR